MLLAVASSFAWQVTRPPAPRTTPASTARIITVRAQVSAPEELLHALHRGAAAKHEAECEAGAAAFAEEGASVARRHFSDGDFDSHCVGMDKVARHHVRDAEWLRGPSLIHVTREPVLSDAEVDSLVGEAAAEMNSGVRAEINYADRQNLAVVHTGQLPQARKWLSRRLGAMPLILRACTHDGAYQTACCCRAGCGERASAPRRAFAHACDAVLASRR
jgi:hypothetical protein